MAAQQLWVAVDAMIVSQVKLPLHHQVMSWVGQEEGQEVEQQLRRRRGRKRFGAHCQCL